MRSFLRFPTRTIKAVSFAGLLSLGATSLLHAQTQPQAQSSAQPTPATQTQSQADPYSRPNNLPAVSTYPETHIEAPGQGAQDPARSEFLEGWSRDKPRCMNTLLARRESRQEAEEVCNKILTDLGD